MNPLNNINNNNIVTKFDEKKSSKRKLTYDQDNVSQISKKLLTPNDNPSLNQYSKSNQIENYQKRDNFKTVFGNLGVEEEKILEKQKKLLEKLEVIQNKKYTLEYFENYKNEYNNFMQYMQNGTYPSIDSIKDACIYLQLAYKVGEKKQNKKFIEEINNYLKNFQEILKTQNNFSIKGNSTVDISNSSNICFIIINFKAEYFDISLLSEFSDYFKARFENFKSDQVFEILLDPLLEANPSYVFDILYNCQEIKNQHKFNIKHEIVNNGWHRQLEHKVYNKDILENLSIEDTLTYYKILGYLQINIELIDDLKLYFKNKFTENYVDFLYLIDKNSDVYLHPKDKEHILNYLLSKNFNEIKSSQQTLQFIEKNISQLDKITFNNLGSNNRDDFLMYDANDEDFYPFKDLSTWLTFLSKTQLKATSLDIVYTNIRFSIEYCFVSSVRPDDSNAGLREGLSMIQLDSTYVNQLMDLITKSPSLKYITISFDAIDIKQFKDELISRLESEKHLHHLEELEISITYSTYYSEKEGVSQLFEWKRIA